MSGRENPLKASHSLDGDRPLHAHRLMGHAKALRRPLRRKLPGEGVAALAYHFALERILGFDVVHPVDSLPHDLGAAVWSLVGGAFGTLSWHAPFAVYALALPLGLLALAAFILI